MTAPAVIALVPDLMDRSRVSASVPGVRFVPDAGALGAAVSESGTAAVVLVDLARPGVLAAVTSLAGVGVRVVGFGSHVDTELLERARAAGAEVHPRSRLFRSLAALLAGNTPEQDERNVMATTLPPLIPVEHLFENPERAGAQISPDGTTLAYLAPEENRLNVWVQPLDGAAEDAVCVTHDHTRGIMSWRWSRDSQRILYLQDQGGNEDFHLHVAELDRATQAARDLTPFEGVRVSLVDVPPADPTHILIAMNRRDPSAFDVHRVDLVSGELELVAENPGDIGDWVVDVEGRVRAAAAQTPAGDTEILVRDAEDEPFRSLTVYDNEDGGDVYGFTPDGTALWVASAKGTDTKRLVRLDTTSAEEDVVDEHPDVDLTTAVIRRRTGELLAAVYVVERLEWHYHDAAFEEACEAARRLHHGDLQGVSMSEDERRWVVTFNDDREPGVTFSFDAGTGEGDFLFKPRPKLDPEALAPMRPVTITARDGHTLHSLLTLPLGDERTGLPTVLLVHGGPWAQDVWGYQPEVQLLANRGYAVLQVNYRGSTGYGKAFTHAAEREFGRKMHDDLVDAVEWAVKEGVADPERIGIYGGSYGGYAALCGVTFTPDLFAAAIAYVGPSSLITLIRSFPPYWRPFLQGTWFRYVGDPGTEEEPVEEVVADLLARSPLTHVDRIATPLMVVQGANDPRVTKVESDQIVAALRERGVDVEYIVKDDEGHGFANPENRLDLYRAMERFFARHLGGRLEATG
ncbi:MAG: S9 family peptidase [Acidimicrobiales bacterium]